jgi:hypothetical protein
MTITRSPVESSNLTSIGYDPGERILAVEFKNGLVYHYHGVPTDVYQDILAAGSKGSYLAKTVKPRYWATRVS